MSRIRAPGHAAPAFKLMADDGSAVSLAGLRGRTVVLYFYPGDDTPTCTAEACDIRDSWSRVKANGAVVLGISPDTLASHAKFKRKYSLPFMLLADTGHRVADAYGVWGEKSTFGRNYMGILRTTFVIDKGGIIQHVFEKVRSRGHAAEIVATLNAIGASNRATGTK